ncbi:MAG TPA: peroxiredoxin [Bacteroidetes bacterium]|nr:peroxiredoxin [Bacteroidota bacterium]
MPLKVGDKAPEFTLHDTEKKLRSLSELLGKKTILAFYPGAFTGVCTKEMCTFRDSMNKLNDIDAQIVGISVDAPFANKAFALQNNLQFPLLSDFSRVAVQKYDVVQANFAGLAGYATAKRSVFVLDRDGIVRFIWVSDNPGVEPEYDEVTKAVEALN